MPIKRKPAKYGLDYIRGREWKPRLYTRAGAQRCADQWARRSGMHGAVGVIADCGSYWRINVGAQPF